MPDFKHDENKLTDALGVTDEQLERVQELHRQIGRVFMAERMTQHETAEDCAECDKTEDECIARRYIREGLTMNRSRSIEEIYNLIKDEDPLTSAIIIQLTSAIIESALAFGSGGTRSMLEAMGATPGGDSKDSNIPETEASKNE
jgi:hypothetical protein